MKQILSTYGDVYDIAIVQANGCMLYDEQGRSYVDFESGVWSAALGHNHPQVTRTIFEQLPKIMHLGYRYKNPVVEEAAAEVLRTVGLKDGKCTFLCSGSEAMEFAVQAVRRIIVKPLMLALDGSYLGAFGSVSKRELSAWHLFYWSGCTECTGDCMYCDSFNSIPFHKVGALVIEPGSTSGLVKFPPHNLVSALVQKIKEQHGLIIANEVTTGLGRTGKWFGCDHYDLSPDVVAIGKHLGNGYPVSAVALSSRVAHSIEQSGFRYAQSHQNDALGCAVAINVLKTLRQEKLIERSHRLGTYLRRRLEALSLEHTCLTEVRGRGLMLAITVDRSDLAALHYKLFCSGFLVGINPAAKVLRLYPPLVISEKDIDLLVEALGTVLKTELTM